jgi:hypothetical protein
VVVIGTTGRISRPYVGRHSVRVRPLRRAKDNCNPEMVTLENSKTGLSRP